MRVIIVKKVTLDDIANELGVSKNTVSRALRGETGVSDDLRGKIHLKAKEVSYKKIKNNVTVDRQVLLLYHKFVLDDKLFWPNVFSGILDYAASHNIGIRSVVLEDRNDAFQAPAAGIQGIVILSTVEDAMLTHLASFQTPMVVVDHYSERFTCDYMNTANENGIYTLMWYLVDNNHRKIGFIGHGQRYSFEMRRRAYLNFMNENGLPVDERFIWKSTKFENIDLYTEKVRMMKTLDRSEWPTVFVCVNDTIAYEFKAALDGGGIRVPEDISLVGFDNVQNYPSYLTTVEVPMKALGLRAISQLMRRLTYPDNPYESVFLHTKLIIRESVKRLT